MGGGAAGLATPVGTAQKGTKYILREKRRFRAKTFKFFS
jgi:hypothetical protein